MRDTVLERMTAAPRSPTSHRLAGHGRTGLVAALAFLASACAAGDPFGLYHPYHEHYASKVERGAAFAAHSVPYGSHERCGDKLAGFVAEEEGALVAEPVRIAANEQVGYRRFGEPGHGVIQEYRCIDDRMHFRAWVEPTAEAEATAAH